MWIIRSAYKFTNIIHKQLRRNKWYLRFLHNTRHNSHRAYKNIYRTKKINNRMIQQKYLKI